MTVQEMKKLVCEAIDKNADKIINIAESIFAEPELGYKEYKTAAKVKAVFELRSACLAGYTPDLSCCHICGNPSCGYLDVSQGTMECDGCRMGMNTGRRVPVSPGVLDAMRYICGCDPKKLFSFSASSDTLEELAHITETYLTTQLERGFSALDFYKSLRISL